MKLRSAGFRLWRLARAQVGGVLTLLLAALVARGFFADLRLGVGGSASLSQVTALSLLLALLVRQLALHVAPAPEAARSILPRWGRELELGLLLLIAIFLLVGATGGPRGAAHSLLYLFIAYAAAFHALPISAVLVGAALFFEHVATPDRALFGEHAAFVLLFCIMNKLFLRAEIWRSRQEMRSRIRREVEMMRQEARDFRLISSALGAESNRVSP